MSKKNHQEEQLDAAGTNTDETLTTELSSHAEDSIEESEDYKALYQRALAEQENMRKRLTTEKDQFAKFAQLGTALDLLPVVDNFYRATDHVPADQKENAWITGILYIQKQLLDVLSSWGVEEMTVEPGQTFTPDEHEALSTTPSDSIAADHIVSIQNRGYRMNGRVIRPAQVVVSSGPESDSQSN